MEAIIKTSESGQIKREVATLIVDGVAISACSIREITYENMRGQLITVPLDDTPTTQLPVLDP